MKGKGIMMGQYEFKNKMDVWPKPRMDEWLAEGVKIKEATGHLIGPANTNQLVKFLLERETKLVKQGTAKRRRKPPNNCNCACYNS